MIISSETGSSVLPLCPVCSSKVARTFYQVQSAPVTCAALFRNVKEARSIPRGRIDLAVCSRCGFVFNRAMNNSLARIGAEYESSQAASPHFGAYASSLARGWVNRLGLRGKTVVEIGCGDGSFLLELVKAGVGRAVGFDPLIGRQHITNRTHPNMEFIAQTFDETKTDIEADAIVCRHTLEHIPDVDRFLRAVASWARRNKNRWVLFEVPASERIFSECAFWDIYYEHCNYFTAVSVRYAFAHAGLEVQNLESVYDDQYLIVEARGTKTQVISRAPNDVVAVQRSVAEFGERANSTIEHARHTIRALAHEGRVALWQGAAKAVGFLTALADYDSVACAIDLNPQRHGKYLPGIGLRVVSPEDISSLNPPNIVLMNPVYFAEVLGLLRQKCPGARLLTVNQVCQLSEVTVWNQTQASP
jgi:hypothetical protein